MRTKETMQKKIVGAGVFLTSSIALLLVVHENRECLKTSSSVAYMCIKSRGVAWNHDYTWSAREDGIQRSCARQRVFCY